MALLKRTLAERLLGLSRINSPALTNCRTSAARAAVNSATLNHQTTSNKLAPDPGDDGIFRRFLHRHSAAATPSRMGFLPTGEKLLEKLRAMDVARERINLDGLRSPAAWAEGELTVADAKKVLKLSQLEKVKSTLKKIEKDCISYHEFLELCVKECSSVNQGQEFAKMLDESGSVIVLGNAVFLRPEQETRQCLAPRSLRTR